MTLPKRMGGARLPVSPEGVRIMLAAALLGMVVDFASFDAFVAPTEQEARRAAAAVVFTGAFERVDVGLELLRAGVVSRLYISGVNANAGILPEGFIAQFQARNPSIAHLPGLAACCVEWGTRAESTLQNARDVKCWANRRGVTGPLLLITSRLHMARAFRALQNALPDREIWPYPVEDAPSLEARLLEYFKGLGAFVAPFVVAPHRLLGPFAGDCPARL
jgi:uncharacterized SAM-binding protein YcdF (DUF218 family)